MKRMLLMASIILFIASPAIASFNLQSIGWLGNADRTYLDGSITCYLGALAPGVPTYFCGWNTDQGFVMDHSWLASDSGEMNKYYKSGATTTTYTAKGR